LLIEEYFRQLQTTVGSAPIVQTSSVTYDSRGSFEGYIRGELYLIDGSTLHIREYVDVEVAIERLTYAYHYIGADGRFRFRYDNTDHHRRLNLPTHPHHKHDGDEEQVVVSPAPDLAAVLAEIEALLPLP
jgi:hypothetical protein